MLVDGHSLVFSCLGMCIAAEVSIYLLGWTTYLTDSTGVENEVDTGYSALFVSSRNSSTGWSFRNAPEKHLWAQCPKTIN